MVTIRHHSREIDDSALLFLPTVSRWDAHTPQQISEARVASEWIPDRNYEAGSPEVGVKVGEYPNETSLTPKG